MFNKLKVWGTILISASLFAGDLSLNNISSDEWAALQALEAEISKMSPEELAAIEAEIEQALNEMPQDQRDKILAEAARFEEQLLEAYNQPPQIPQQVTPSQPAPKKDTPKTQPIDQTKHDRVTHILQKLSRNLDELQLLVANSPVLKSKLDFDLQWLQFADQQHLLQSLVKSTAKNKTLLEHLTQTEWETLQKELSAWGNGLEQVLLQPMLDGDAMLSRQEAEAAHNLLSQLLNNYSAENTVWSLKRLFQKYADDELKRVEKAEAERAKKAPYHFPQARRDVTVDTRAVPSRPKKVPTKGGAAYVPSASASSGLSGQKGTEDAATPEAKKDKDKKKGDKKKKDKDKDKDKKDEKDKKSKDGKKKDDKKKDVRTALWPKTLKKLQDSIKMAEKIVPKLKQLDGSAKMFSRADKLEIVPELVQLRSQIANSQRALLDFIDNGKINNIAKGDFSKLVGYEEKKDEKDKKPNQLTKLALEFAELKLLYSIDIKSHEQVLAYNSRIDSDPSGKGKVANWRVLPGGLPQLTRAAKNIDVINDISNLIADIADRLLTMAALVEDADAKKEALEMLSKVRGLEIKAPEKDEKKEEEGDDKDDEDEQDEEIEN